MNRANKKVTRKSEKKFVSIVKFFFSYLHLPWGQIFIASGPTRAIRGPGSNFDVDAGSVIINGKILNVPH